jgi:phosphoribosylamine-glycine ligase
VAVGPEDPLAQGICDVLEAEGIKCFGPSLQGAQIEANKDWSKSFMLRHQIPTAKYASFVDPDKAKEFIRRYFYLSILLNVIDFPVLALHFKPMS